jgi:hypothetical protein
LAWYPKAAAGPGALEALVAYHDGKLDECMLKIVRIQAACPICIEMNSFQSEETHFTKEELTVCQGRGRFWLIARVSPMQAGMAGFCDRHAQPCYKFHPCRREWLSIKIRHAIITLDAT